MPFGLGQQRGSPGQGRETGLFQDRAGQGDFFQVLFDVGYTNHGENREGNGLKSFVVCMRAKLHAGGWTEG